MLTANVYIDGFNRFYRCLRGTPYKWLDVARLAAHLLPKGTVVNRGSSIHAVSTWDITERRQADVTLQRSAAIVDSSDRVIIGRDLHGIMQSGD